MRGEETEETVTKSVDIRPSCACSTETWRKCLARSARTRGTTATDEADVLNPICGDTWRSREIWSVGVDGTTRERRRRTENRWWNCRFERAPIRRAPTIDRIKPFRGRRDAR